VPSPPHFPGTNASEHGRIGRGATPAANAVSALRIETMGFPGQVVLVHGDPHYFKIDKPVSPPSAACPARGPGPPQGAYAQGAVSNAAALLGGDLP
jgi:hypothetical protein